MRPTDATFKGPPNLSRHPRRLSHNSLLLGKPPLPHKIQKNNVFFTISGGRTDDLSLLKGFLHNCGRAGISFKQVKKIR